tara:strand:+ start:6287 stop:6451 length:165 start_codon:yes stop_codon:yes gene_type:complete
MAHPGHEALIGAMKIEVVLDQLIVILSFEEFGIYLEKVVDVVLDPVGLCLSPTV